jgi:hypothetical protein
MGEAVIFPATWTELRALAMTAAGEVLLVFSPKRTLTGDACMSALCQKRTLRTLLGGSETIVVFSSTGAAGSAESRL